MTPGAKYPSLKVSEIMMTSNLWPKVSGSSGEILFIVSKMYPCNLLTNLDKRCDSDDLQKYLSIIASSSLCLEGVGISYTTTDVKRKR